jgi:phage shock protein A
MSSSASATTSYAELTTSRASVERKLKCMREIVEELQRQAQQAWQQFNEMQQQGAEVLAEIEKVDTAHK